MLRIAMIVDSIVAQSASLPSFTAKTPAAGMKGRAANVS
jgi:hypothetical protein